jgi:hypothetical protein
MEKEECCGGKHILKRQIPCLMITEEGLDRKVHNTVVHFFVYYHKE